MSLLARSFAALALTALAAGVVTVAPAGVAAASRDGASAFGTTQTQPTSQTVRKANRATRGAVTRSRPEIAGDIISSIGGAECPPCRCDCVYYEPVGKLMPVTDPSGN